MSAPRYTEAKAVAAAPPKAADKSAGALKGNRQIPPVGQLSALQFPSITHTRLCRTGSPVDYAQRTAVPVTQVALSFDAGDVRRSPAARGLASITMDLLDEGTPTLTSQEFAEAQERLGADISTTAMAQTAPTSS